MDTYNQSQPKTDRLEQFLDSLEQEEAVDDVPASEIEESETAYQEYLAGRDSGKSLEELKKEFAWMQ
ncbi:MAG TPA: hypothetical protein ACFCUY_09365 [Xenococcaceae cyanobacterium]